MANTGRPSTPRPWTPEWVPDALGDIESAGRLRQPSDIELLPGGRLVRNSREMLHFASNDYLGLASHPKVIAAAVECAGWIGVGSRASAVVARSEQQKTLEETLASFEGTEAALVFPSGYAANLGVVAALAQAGDTIFCDKENHACLIDGARISGASLRVYQRSDLSKLNDRLAKVTEHRKFVVTDSVFSMDGTMAPLPDLQEIAIRHHATLIVDEAHATGVYGDRGSGACEHLELSDDHVIRTGTLSKAIGCQGGFVVGSRQLIDYLWNTARTQMFSTGLAVPVCAAATAAIGLIASGAVRYDFAKLAPLDSLRSISSQPPSPIVPVIIGDRDQTLAIANQLEEAGCFVGAIREPTVPRGTSRLRITITRSHAIEEVEGLASLLRATLPTL